MAADRPPITAEGDPLTTEQALSLAIFAINTFIEPSASSDADIAVLDARAGEAVARLYEVRERYRNVSG